MGIVYWSPLSIFVSLNKELESGEGTKLYVLVFPVGGGFENSTCLKRGQRKNTITVEFLLSPPGPVQSITSGP
jgi:hypothetical protein